MEDSSEPYEPDTDNTGGGRCKSRKAFAARDIGLAIFSGIRHRRWRAPRLQPAVYECTVHGGFFTYINISHGGKT